MVADELRRQADQFLELADIAPEFTRRQTEPRARPTPAAPDPGRAVPGHDRRGLRAAARRRADRAPHAGAGPRDCPLCPRLVAYRAANRAAHPDWFNAPVPSFGALDARLLVVGLAPGVRGANRTGRPFTGDFAGVLLYQTLLRFGFAAGRYGADPTDGLRLVDCRVTNAVRCVPPGNLPLPVEIAACNRFLAAEFAAMPRLRAVLALGGIAHNAVLRGRGLKPGAREIRPWRGARIAGRVVAGRQLSRLATEHEHRAADRGDVCRGGRGFEATTGMRRPPHRRARLRGALAATAVPTWAGPTRIAVRREGAGLRPLARTAAPRQAHLRDW